MRLLKVSPTRLRLEGASPQILDLVATKLTYRAHKVTHDLQRLKRQRHYLSPLDYESQRKTLKDQEYQCLLESNETWAGLAPFLEQLLEVETEDQVEYPEMPGMAWSTPPANKLRPYQQRAIDALLATPHSSIEHATGLGKATTILYLVRTVGLGAVVQAPSKSTARQLYNDFVRAFGKRYVGLYGDGKKEANKKIVVGLGQSLCRIPEGSKDWQLLAAKPVYIVDESHMTPAQTLRQVGWGLMANAPYRWFFSATQLRNDGLDLVLQAIIGPVVDRMSTREGVDQGYLSRPLFRVFSVPREDGTQDYSDPMKTHRENFVHHKRLHKLAAMLANSFASQKISVLILVDEMPQFAYLLPHLRHEVWFAHGGITEDKDDSKERKEVLAAIPDKYRDPDVEKLVDGFNAGGFPILVGTSAVSTGTDFRPVGVILYLMGGASEIQVRQAIGRGTRRPKGKVQFCFIDFDILDCETTHRHADTRRAIYEEVYGPVEEVDV